MSKIGVVGAGYVGTTTAACLAHLGHDVVCGDVDEHLVERLRQGEVPILEEHLPELIREGLDNGRLRFEVGAAAAARGSEFVFLCVQTPEGPDGAPDLAHLEAAAREIAPQLEPEAVVVTRSTVPVGSTRRVRDVLEEAGARHVRVASNPEFLQEGRAVHEFLQPSRIVLGVDDEETAVRLSLLYRRLQARVIVTAPASAEMIKYASNAYLATRISFVNSVANLCEEVGADIADVSLGMGYDPRIGFSALNAGPGFGGSCLPKDTAALLHTAEVAGFDFAQLRATVEVNEHQRDRVVEKIQKALGGTIEGAPVAVWGLTFKAGTDDVRESPAVDIAARLLAQGAVVSAYDPVAGERAAERLPGLRVVGDAYAACERARCLAVLTEWDEFRWLDFGRVRDLMATPAVVDARNLLDQAALRAGGFDYQGVGRA